MKLNHILAAAALALATHAHATSHQPPGATLPAAVSADGEVRKVDKEQGKVTLRHGRIENLDMPGMTMVFRVADPGMLDGLKEGDKVRFAADRRGGAITLTAIEVVK